MNAGAELAAGCALISGALCSGAVVTAFGLGALAASWFGGSCG